MVEEEPGSVANALPALEPPPPRHDFSVVQGFQVVDAEDQRSARAGDEAWREALKLELEARAERLRQAVDGAIVLSNDGIIRWLGDPVAKISPGPNALNPSAVIFADESLPDASRETIKTRIELWIAATTRRLLAPLFALDCLQEGPEIVRDLAREMVRSLGVLDREPIKAKIRTLTQDDRAELRKQGVRFGAYYLFLPMLLKPAARTLALQLWALQASGDATELLRTLAPIASSGRTSLASDAGIGKEGYRVAGYRTCGERIVRVDVLERLAGMIRAAIAGEVSGGADGPPSQRASKGFVVSGAMTSLTGCSGEQFASILRSIGFRSVEMKRSEFFGSQSASESARGSEPLKSAEEPGSTPGEQTSGDNQVNPADSVPGAAPTKSPSNGALAETDAIADAGGFPKGDEASSEDGEAAAEAVADPEEADAGLEEVDVAANDAEGAPEGGQTLRNDACDIAEGGEPISVDSPTLSTEGGLDAAGAVGGSPAADAGGAPVPPQASDSPADQAKNDEMIVVWRPDHRRTAPRREREPRHTRSEAPGRSETERPAPPAPNWRRETAAHPSPRPNRPNSIRGDEKRRQRAKDYDMPRTAPTTPPPQKPAKVDPNSPFAKLLELRSLLEEQASKRR